jgi:glyoxylate reductase
MLGTGLSGKELGVVGLGRIGAPAARLAEAFGMRIVYTSRSGPKDGVELEWLPFDELFRTADVVTLHCPLTPETRHSIGADELRSMRRDGLLVNTTRGPVVDQNALVTALRADQGLPRPAHERR